MKLFDVVLLTESRYYEPDTVDWYIRNILDEDELLRIELESKGLKVTRQDWASEFDWSSTRSVLFRTTWDYFNRITEFSDWLEYVSGRTNLINPLHLIRWNMDKRYLIDLGKKGIPIPPTVIIEQGTRVSLREVLHQTGWKESILKPAVSGAARHTFRLDQSNLQEHEKTFMKLVRQETMLIQEFQYHILERGEVAFMLFGGKFSHAIQKKAKPGDFRVQDDFGGTVHAYEPQEDEILFAENVVSVCDTVPAYARVDAIWDNSGNLVVSELELIEPELWFRFCPESAGRMAASVANELAGMHTDNIP